MIDYGWLGGIDEKRTHSNGWVEFHNHENKSGTIWVHEHKMGSLSLGDGKKYPFNILSKQKSQQMTQSDHINSFCAEALAKQNIFICLHDSSAFVIPIN